MIVRLGDSLRTEGVGGNDIGACYEIGTMYIGNDIRTGNREYIIITLQLPGDIHKAIPAEIYFPEAVGLNLRSHRSIEDENAILNYIVKSTIHYSLITILFTYTPSSPYPFPFGLLFP